MTKFKFYRAISYSLENFKTINGTVLNIKLPNLDNKLSKKITKSVTICIEKHVKNKMLYNILI